MARVTEEQYLKFYFKNFNLNSHIWLVSIVLDSTNLSTIFDKVYNQIQIKIINL